VAAGVIVGVVLTSATGALLNDEAAPVAAPTVVAETALAALPKKQGTGRAEIVDTGSGKELVVDVSDLGAEQGFFEVWLIDPETFQMVGLGALTESEGHFPIPDGLDLAQYRVVDVSLEPLDGDPAHSRDSLVRGELDV
jgi:anti-sigma-K factor RskA